VDGHGAGVGEGDGLWLGGVAYLRCGKGKGALRGGVGDEWRIVAGRTAGDGCGGAGEVDGVR